MPVRYRGQRDTFGSGQSVPIHHILWFSPKPVELGGYKVQSSKFPELTQPVRRARKELIFLDILTLDPGHVTPQTLSVPHP